MLVQLCLIIMGFFSLFSIILGNTFSVYSGTINIDNSVIVNGSTSTFEIPDVSYSLDLTSISIGLTFLTVVFIVVVVAVGITVLGSGLSTTSAKYILGITAYASLWGVLSVLSLSLITQIEIYGSLIYIFLTIMYIVGIIGKLSNG